MTVIDDELADACEITALALELLPLAICVQVPVVPTVVTGVGLVLVPPPLHTTSVFDALTPVSTSVEMSDAEIALTDCTNVGATMIAPIKAATRAISA